MLLTSGVDDPNYETVHAADSRQLKMLKSYYNKDASASVAKSLLTIHDNSQCEEIVSPSSDTLIR